MLLKKYLPIFPFFLSGLAQAYLPPSDYVVKMVVKKHDTIKAVRLKSTVSTADNSAHFIETTFFDAERGLLRSIAKDDTGQELFRMERKDLSESVVSEILFETRAPRLVQDLKQKGVPIVTESELQGMKDEAQRQNSETEFLGRFKTAVAWVIGKNDKSSAQLWVEKDTFLPMKFVFGPKVSAGGEVTMENFRFNREFPYPRLITYVRANAQPAFKVEATEVVVNPAEGSDLRGMVGYGITEAGSASASNLKDLLQSYYELIR